MSITRPVNSSGTETIQMPQMSNLPDTSPIQMSIWLNRCFMSLAHMHNNGSQTAPEYIGEGGTWARPLLDGTQALVRQGNTDQELWYTDANGLCLPFGYTKAMEDASDLNSLVKEGMYHFTTATTNIPAGFTGGTVWVQRSRRSATSTVHNQLIISDSAVMCYRTGFSGGTVASLSWGDWRYLQYETAVPTVIPGAIIAFDGSFGGQSNRYPINAITGKVDLSYALCDGATHLTEDGRTVTTPDLTDKFIKSTAPANVNQTGGGGATVHYTTLTASEIPSHSHRERFLVGGQSGWAPYPISWEVRDATYWHRVGSGTSYSWGPTYGPSGTSITLNIGGAAAEGSTITSYGVYTGNTGGSTGHTHGISGVEPVYYTLAYIKKL